MAIDYDVVVMLQGSSFYYFCIYHLIVQYCSRSLPFPYIIEEVLHSRIMIKKHLQLNQ